MPSECRNRLLISGDSNGRLQFVLENILGKDIDFRVAIPVEPYDRLAAENLWGTSRWLEGTTKLSGEPGKLIIDFDTAWTPPIKWVKTISRIYPKLEFELVWYELGIGKYGVYRFHHNDYSENHKYNIIDGDIMKLYEKDGDEKPDREEGAGRFAEILDQFDLTYEAGL